MAASGAPWFMTMIKAEHSWQNPRDFNHPVAR
jgi:hypothetical protein